jgi:uncharacterized phage protein (TIGR01671 family)
MTAPNHREIRFRAWDIEHSRMITMRYRAASEVLSEASRGDWAVMQFTGLHDKNGKDVFEGDILFYNSTGYIGEVAYSTYGGCGFYVFENGIDSEFGGKKLIETVADLEIVGNIYESPELLEIKG